MELTPLRENAVTLFARTFENQRAGQRWGQALFNALPSEWAIQILEGGIEDPYEIDTRWALDNWVTSHLVWEATGTFVVGVQ